MFRRASAIQGFTLCARDGKIGRTREFYFNDDSWTIRYLVADTGRWLAARQVLISPQSIIESSEENKNVSVALTRVQIEKSPSIDQDKPVSRQFEEEYARYYAYPFYWQAPGDWGPLPRPGTSYGQVTGPIQQTWPPEHSPDRPAEPGDPNLRSTKEVTGYHVGCIDGDLGHVEDFVIDDQEWVIRYIEVDTAKFLPGKKVLVPPQWAGAVDWHQSRLHFNLEREVIRSAPTYDASQPISREYEERLFAHYNRDPYWDQRAAA